MSDHRRPRRSGHATSVDEQHRLAGTELAHADRNRRIREPQQPALALESVVGKKTTLRGHEALSGGHAASLPRALMVATRRGEESVEPLAVSMRRSRAHRMARFVEERYLRRWRGER